jgi:type VI secretion system protein VasD
MTLIMGCGKKAVAPEPPPTLINVEIVASAQVNPDGSGRPSPIVVRLYELKGLTRFNATDFYSLYSDDEAQIGGDLGKREQFILRPGSQKNYSHETPADTQYLGVIAAYRNIDRAVWRASVPIPAHRTTNFTILLDTLGLSLQAL